MRGSKSRAANLIETRRPLLVGMARWAGREVYLPEMHPAQRQQVAEEIRGPGDERDLPAVQVLNRLGALSEVSAYREVPPAAGHADLASFAGAPLP